jgi:hypothetical protein
MTNLKSVQLGTELLYFLFGGFTKLAIATLLGVSVLGGIIGIYLAASDSRGVEVYSTLAIGSVGAVGLKMPDAASFGGQDSVRIIESTRYYGLEPGRRLLIGSSELYRNIFAEYDLASARKRMLPPPFITNIDGQNSDGLRVYVWGDTEKQAIDFLHLVLGKIKVEHALIFDDSVKVLHELRDLNFALIELAKDSPGDSISALLPIFVNQKYEIERALSPINTRRTNYSKILVRELPRKSIVLNGLIGLIVGIFFGYLSILGISIYITLQRRRGS